MKIDERDKRPIWGRQLQETIREELGSTHNPNTNTRNLCEQDSIINIWEAGKHKNII